VVAVVTIASALLLDGAKPSLTKQEAISAALGPGIRAPVGRMSVKLVHRFDLQAAYGNAGSGSPFDKLWLVAVSGDFGIESTMTNDPNTWGVAIIVDRRPARVEAYLNDSKGDWPPFWHDLPDLSHQ
jgi:hypothetical protein